MTEPTDPTAGADGADGGPPPPALDAAGTDALVQRLRTEPVEIDELARERRISAALDAATYLGTAAEPATAPVPTARRTAPRRGWLAAAAVLAVVGLGGYLVATTAGSGSNDESGSAEMATSGAGDATVDPAAQPDAAAEQSAPTSTVAPLPEPGAAQDADGRSADAALVDLGAYADLAELRAAVMDGSFEAAPPAAPQTGAPADGTGADPERARACAAELVARGEVVVGVASVAGREVLVVRGDPPGVVDVATCSPR